MLKSTEESLDSGQAVGRVWWGAGKRVEARKLGLLGNTSARVVETKKLSRVTLGGLMGVPVDTRLLRAHETVSACAVNETGQPKDLGDGINHHIPFGSTVTRGGPHPPPQRTLASRCGTGRAGFGLSLEDARPRAPPAGAALSRGSSHRRPSAYASGLLVARRVIAFTATT